MVQQNGKVSGGKPPISKHPLFPAIVALWFGALFGLGSLAVRPALFESVVISSGLDTLVPAAAPPLGTTARVLIAVVLAAIGGVCGALIGRRISREKPVERTRRRGADRSAVDTDTAEPTAREGGGLRRRALAISEEEEQFAVYEAAPLPGGSPGILDVTAVDIDAAAISPDAGRSAPAEADVPLPPVIEVAAPMELTEVVTEAPAIYAAPPPVMPVAAAEDSPSAAPRAFDRPAAAADPAPFAPLASEPSIFNPAAPEPFQPATITLEQFAPEAAPRFAAPQPVANDAPAAVAPAATSAPATSPLVLETARPIDFTQPAFQPVADYAAAEEPDAAPIAAPQAPAVAEPVSVAAIAADRPAAPAAPALLAAAPTPAPFPTVLGEGDIARIADAELDTLSPVELVERLAISIQQRRKARLAASTAAAATAVASASTAEPVEAERAEDARSFSAEALPEAAPIPVAYAPPPAPEPGPEAAASPAAPFIPAALRPLSLDPVEDSDDLDLGAIPPRHIALAPSQPLFAAEPETAGFAEPEPVAPELGESDSIPEEAYSSLLDLGRPADPRPGFVRIDEPEAELSTPEPVVVFPGQTNQPAAGVTAAAFAAPAPHAANGMESGARRFDAPGLASGAPASFSAAAPAQQDPAETEQALRNALANLQRMSGAA